MRPEDFFGGLLLLASLAVAPWPAHGDEKVCETPAQSVAQVQSDHGVMPEVHLRGEAAAEFVEKTGGVEGRVTDLLAWHHVHNPEAYLAAAYVEGCLVGTAILPAPLVNRLLGKGL